MHKAGETFVLRYVRLPLGADDSRVHFRTRFKCARRNSEAISHRRVILNQDGKGPVITRARLCDQPVRDFLLNHYGYVDDLIAVIDESLQ